MNKTEIETEVNELITRLTHQIQTKYWSIRVECTEKNEMCIKITKLRKTVVNLEVDLNTGVMQGVNKNKMITHFKDVDEAIEYVMSIGNIINNLHR